MRVNGRVPWTPGIEGQAAGVVQYPQSQAILGRSRSQEHGRCLGGPRSPSRGLHGPRRDTSQPLHQTPPWGVGVYGELYGIEGDGMEAGEIFEPVNFWGV